MSGCPARECPALACPALLMAASPTVGLERSVRSNTVRTERRNGSPRINNLGYSATVWTHGRTPSDISTRRAARDKGNECPAMVSSRGGEEEEGFCHAVVKEEKRLPATPSEGRTMLWMMDDG